MQSPEVLQQSLPWENTFSVSKETMSPNIIPSQKQIDFLKRLSGYYLEILGTIRSSSTTFLIDMTQGRGHDYVDLSFLTENESLLTQEEGEYIISPSTEEELQEKQNTSLFEKSNSESQLLRDRYTVFQHLRELEQRHKINPFEKEFLYAYPFLIGKNKDGKDICAPLITVQSEVDYDLKTGKIKISLAKDPIINLDALGNLLNKTQSQYLQMHVLGKEGIPTLPLLDEKEFLAFLRCIINVAPDVFEPINNWSWALEHISKKFDHSLVSQSKAQIRSFSALLLVGRTDYYLRDNLEKLHTSIEDPGNSVFSTFFTDEITNPSDSNEPLSQEDSKYENLVYPFEANQWQKEVANAIEHHRLVAVQGPPGTGKSQTISNLICHLVSQGKTVLLTSQKNKALKVVSEKWLSKLKIDYLFMALLKKERESKQELLKLLNRLGNYINVTPSLEVLDKKSEELVKKLTDYRIEAHNLKQKFEAAKNRENGYYQKYENYYKTRNDDIIPNEITLADITPDLLANDLFNYSETYINGSSGFVRDKWYEALKKWSLEIPEMTYDPDGIVRLLNGIVTKLGKTAVLVSVAEIVKLRKRLLEDQTFSIEYVPNLLEFLKEVQPFAIEFVKQRNILRNQYEEGAGLVEIANKIGVLDKPMRERISFTIDRLLEPARKIVENSPARWYQPVRRIKQFYNSNKFNEIYNRLPSQLKLDKLQQAKKEFDIVKLQNEIDKLRNTLTFSNLANQINHSFAKESYPLLKISELEVKTISEIKELLTIKTGALQLFVLADEVRNDLPRIKPIADAYEIYDLIESTEPTVFEEKTSILNHLASGFPFFAKLMNLEARLGVEITDWVRSYLDTEQADTIERRYWDIFYRAIKAHQLYQFIEQDCRENIDDTQTISQKLSELKVKEKETIKQLLDTKIKRNLKSKYSRSVAQTIWTLIKALKVGKKSFASYEFLKERIDFRDLLKVLPCWIMDIDDVCRIFPLAPELFDVLIVDEASQCHLMGALPLLYRSKSAIIVGDKNQLPNADLMFLDSQKNTEKKRMFGIESLPKGLSFGVENSLIEFADFWKEKECSLREHFRSVPEIIRFCNEKFYGWLKIMTHSLDVPPDGVFEIKKVEGALENEEDKVNPKEADELMNDLIQRLKDPRYKEFSFGVLSPFREQADYLKKLLERRLLAEPELRNRLPSEPTIGEAVDGFQGDERDIIFYSFRYAPNSSRSIFSIERGREETGKKRMNVAFSRARKKVVCYISHDIEKFPNGFIKDFLIYARSPGAGIQPGIESFDSDFEKDVYERLKKLDYDIISQYPTCGFFIDLVMKDKSGRRMAIECDGMFHYDESGELRIEDIIRQEALERAGWFVYRIPSSRYWRNPEKCIQELISEFNKLPSKICTLCKENISQTIKISPKNLSPEKETTLPFDSSLSIERSKTQALSTKGFNYFIKELSICPYCGEELNSIAENAEDLTQCSNCGTFLSCPNCGENLQLNDEGCLVCPGCSYITPKESSD